MAFPTISDYVWQRFQNIQRRTFHLHRHRHHRYSLHAPPTSAKMSTNPRVIGEFQTQIRSFLALYFHLNQRKNVTKDVCGAIFNTESNDIGCVSCHR